MNAHDARRVGSITVPTVIADRYHVEREIGRGGMATVYLCTDSRDSSQVAIKVLRAELGSAVVVERFLREIAFSSELDHPQIPRVLDSGLVDGLPFYSMDFIEGETLRSLLDRVKQLPVDEAVRITKEVVGPTAYAHDRGIVHRDLKPANILLAQGRVYVLDFGVARAILASADDRLTSTGIAVGTPAYMSPEQALADRDIDARSDIYSLACVTYEMIAGIPPFVGATAQAVMARRFVAQPAPLSETRESVPDTVERAVAKALCKAPADRWQTIAEFGAALSAPALPQSDTRQLTLRGRQFRRSIVTGAILLMLIVVAVVAFSLFDRNTVAKGQLALDKWQLKEADRQFRRAISNNANDPVAHLWLAQLLIINRAPSAEWAPLTLEALDRKADLSPRDRLRAEALAAYADDEGSDRCRGIRTLAAASDPRRPDDFTATITLADCLAADPTVVKDGTARTGYRFASSYQESIRLYEGLIERNSSNGTVYRLLMPRLERVLWTTKNRLRGGSLRGETATTFVASPALVSDTISFEPSQLSGNGPGVVADAEKLDRLVARNLEKLKALATAWTRASPDDPDAQESLASVLESKSQIDGSGASALASIRAARQAAAANGEPAGTAYFRRIRLANTNVRLLLKLGRFREARILSDSAVSWRQPESSDDSLIRNSDGLRSGLFALTGRQQSVISLEQKYAGEYFVRLPSGETKKLTADLGADALRLATYTAFGVPRDSITATERRIKVNLESLVPSAQIADYRVAVLRRPLSLSLDVIGTKLLAGLGPSSDPFIRAVRAVDVGQFELARQLTDTLAAFRAGNAPGEVTMDVVLQDAWLRAAVGDTLGATRAVDLALRGLSRAPSNLLEGVELPTALVRVMLMRARLAESSGDIQTSTKWLGAVRELWKNADPGVLSLVYQSGRIR